MDFDSHPLVRDVVDNLRPFIIFTEKLNKLMNEEDPFAKSPFGLPENYQYEQGVLHYTSHIFESIRRLYQSHSFIDSYSTLNVQELKTLSQHDWLEYHYSYYQITLIGIFDIALILTNWIFRLGYSEYQCRPKQIKNHQGVANTPVKKNLVDLEKIIKPYKLSRNKHVHQGEMPELEQILDTETYWKLQLLRFDQNEENPVIEPEKADHLFDVVSNATTQHMYRDIQILEGFIWALLDSLLPIHKSKSTLMHQEWQDELEQLVHNSPELEELCKDLLY